MAAFPITPSELVSAVDLDQPIAALNDVLAPLEQLYVDPFDAPDQPIIFIVGAPRSGTTLLSQLLIARYRIGYVSNLVARFWKAPYLGLLLMQNIREAGRSLDVDVSSDHGFTTGYEGPHEFGYFWRRWFDYQDSHWLSDEQIAAIDAKALSQETAAMQSVDGSPFLFKNLVCSFQVKFLARTLPSAVFVHCQREPIFVAQSLLKCRERHCNDLEEWFSVKPRAYPELRNRPYPDQIAGQIFHTRRHIEKAFAELDDNRVCHIRYESLVENPLDDLDDIAETVRYQDGTMKTRDDFSTPALQSTNRFTVSPGVLDRLEASCRQFF